MEAQKTFIIGDVHGCLGMLLKLMDKIEWRPETDQAHLSLETISTGEKIRVA